MIARKVKDLTDWKGNAAVYELTPPMETSEESKATYVAVSACNTFDAGPETFIFPCDEDGEVTCWTEQDGSFRGGLDHAKALRGAGYEIKANQ